MGCELYSRVSSLSPAKRATFSHQAWLYARTRHPELQAQSKVQQLIIRYTSHVKKEKATSTRTETSRYHKTTSSIISQAGRKVDIYRCTDMHSPLWPDDICLRPDH